MEAYETLSEAISALREQGYTRDFNLTTDNIACASGEYCFFPDEFAIDKSFRFDVDEDPSDQAMLYAISSKEHDEVKGVLVNGYGVYSDDTTNDMLTKLGLH